MDQNIEAPKYDTRRALSNVTTADAYTTANQLYFPAGVYFTLFVSNASIFWQLGFGDDVKAITWGPEIFSKPISAGFNRRFDAIRIRSAVAATPAQVTIECLTQNDVP